MIRKAYAALSAFAAILTILQGCEGKSPSTPARFAGLTVSVPLRQGANPSFLTAAQNEILYRIDGAGITLQGTVGPFSAATASGSYSFVLNGVPVDKNLLLSLQLNDASTHAPLAVGAAPILPSKTDVTIDLGSVSRSCYQFNSSFTGYGYGYSYGFASESQNFSVTVGFSYDIAFNTTGTNFFIQDANSSLVNTISYLGNGKLVDFDRLPSSGSFYSTSTAAKAAAGAPVTTLQVGDIYCLELGTLVNGHAWIQITNPGTVSTQGPNFIFRVNDQVPYYAYERTPGDLATAGNCDLYCPGQLGHYNPGTPSNTYPVSVLWFAPVTTGGPVTLAGMAYYQTGSGISSGPVTFEMGVYSDAPGKPANLLGSTSYYVTTNPGLVTAPLATPLALAGSTVYWLCVHAEELNSDGSLAGNYANYTLPVNVYGSLPASIPAAAAVTGSLYTMDVYGIYCY